MADSEKGKVTHESDRGISAQHPKKARAELSVAASTSERETFNTFRAEKQIEACWKVGDICFDFDRVFVRPDAKDEFEELADLYSDIIQRAKRHPNYRDSPKSPITIFGHADPVGNDDYNKKLSENRAKAIYGVLTRNADAWEEIYKGDREDIKHLQSRLASLGHDPGPVDGVIGQKTRKAILSYMDELCSFKDESGGDFRFKLEDSDFLGDGECAYQGCSEFNPLRMFSREQNDYFKDREHREERNAENQVNRRVVAFLFKPKTLIDPAEWPCESSAEPCKKRFWSDWEERRQFQKEGREYKPDEKKKGEEKRDADKEGEWEYKATTDTFACRFYERLTHLSPCEKAIEPPTLIEMEFFVYDVSNCGVECKVLLPPKNRVLLARSGSCSASKKTYDGKREKVENINGKKLNIYSSRMKVMEEAGELEKEMDGSAVKYKGDYYPTERHHLVIDVAMSDGDFESKKKLKYSHEHGTNELAIAWDDKNKKVIKYTIDGEEMDVE